MNLKVTLMEENVIQIKKEIMIKVDGCKCKRDQIFVYLKKFIFGILLHVVAKMINIYQVLWWFSDYLWWNYRLEINKKSSNKFQWKITICKTQDLYVLLSFLLITVTSLTAVSIYYYLIKCNSKQKHLLPISC